MQLNSEILNQWIERSQLHVNMKQFVVLLYALSAFYVELCNSQEVVIDVKPLGQVRGSKMSTVSDREFYAFRGIPYAEPPIGDLRFKVRYLFEILQSK